MKPIICDSFEPIPTHNKRFYTGYDAYYIATGDDSLRTNKAYEISNRICLSFTQSTTSNIFYLVKHYNIDRLQEWINEISPQFPSLQIKLLKFLKKDYPNTSFPDRDRINSLFFTQYDVLGSLITMRLEMSSKSDSVYNITNKRHAKYGYFSDLKFLIKLFIDYCIKEKVTIEKEEEFSDIVSTFCYMYLDSILAEFKKDNRVKIKLDSDNPLFEGTYEVISNCTIDITSVNYQNLYKYINSIVSLNYKRFISIINLHQSEETYDTALVQVLYSKKSYPLESYLATHLVRIGLAEELFDFMDQYYMIKETVPELSFWKRIVYTLFGFDFHAYYWLTGDRTFKAFTEDDFILAAKISGHGSSHSLFHKFSVELSEKKIENLKRLYSIGDFRAFVNAIENPKCVSLKESKKGKLNFLKILDKYEIFDEDTKNYFIKSDDFRVRKYSKSNFVAA